jgi:cystathionine beta-lyase/cystathionine gamma-synthase
MSSRLVSRSKSAFATRAVHGAGEGDPATGAIVAPICQSTTFRQLGIGRDLGHTYSRASNPTVAALERALGALEGVLPAVCTSSGMAAITTLFLSVLGQGERVVVGDVVYGGTVRLLRQVLANFGVEPVFVDTSDLGALERALLDGARVLFLESPANPTLKLTDLAAASAAARAAGALCVVDNTFLTPAHQDAFALGADVVVHSTTKYLEGHNATLGGALLTKDGGLRERFELVRKSLGTIQAPFEAWLTLRGLKTLELRLARHAENALAIARWLEQHPAVARVSYPWLESHPQFELARRQQRSGGGIVAFELAGGLAAGKVFAERVALWSLAENLGAPESLVTHPATMTHAAYTAEERARLGIGDGLVRLSVGLEDPQDLIADLAQALAAFETAEVQA